MQLVVDNKEFIAIIISCFAVALPFTTFFITKRKEQEDSNFEKLFNNLMKGLANLDAKTGLDQQVFILYELRNYPKYHPVVKRLLNTQIRRWKSLLKASPHYSVLITEAEETIYFINRNIFQKSLDFIKIRFGYYN